MKFIHRVGYYLGGFAIGLIFLAFFLSGKRTSCDYGPNARTIKNISIKTKHYSEDAQLAMQTYELDTVDISNLIKFGSVSFSDSDTKAFPCKYYSVKNSYKNQSYKLWIRNCDSIATIESIEQLNK